MRKNLLKNEHLASTVQIVLGCALGALAYPLFLVPNHIAPGGLTGLATVLNYLFHWPVGTTSLLMNIPLFIIGYRAMGRVFVIRSLVATVLFSVLIDLIPLPPMTQQPLLGAVFGGVLLGAGLGLILRGGATTGGTDFIAMYMAQKHDRDAFGTIFIFNAIMLAVAGYLFGWDKAMYSIIYQFTVTQALHVFYKNYQKHTLFIITEKPAEVYERIRISTHHGATLFHGTGLYKKEERSMVYSVVSSDELRHVLAEVRRVDDHAFVNILKTDQLTGRFYHRPTD